MKLLLIHNSKAGGGRGRRMLQGIEERFRGGGAELDVAPTTRAGDGITLTQEADLSAYDGVVAAGGDGTVYEVVTGYYRNPASNKPPLGIIPCGSGNAFVRELDFLRADWPAAVDTVLAGKSRAVDVARFTTEGVTHHSLNILGAGFVSDVNETAVRFKFLGNNAYMLGVFYRLARLRFHPMEITFDGQSESVEAIFATVLNSRFTGTTFLMAPKAQIDDGLLDLVVVRRMSRGRILRLFKTIFTGDHIHEPEVDYYQARDVSIRTPEPSTLNVDGEVLGSTPVEIRCLPRDLQVFWRYES